MAVYVIGDIQGCFTQLQRLLAKLEFDASRDRLWFVGDLVNRGPDSLKTLRFIRDLGEAAQCTLGNHDLHLLATYYTDADLRVSDTLKPLLKARDCGVLLDWLRQRPLFHFDMELNFGMVHAGIYPGWNIPLCLQLAAEVEEELRGPAPQQFLRNMYGNQPECWDQNLRGVNRLRFIVNVFTRMRYVTRDLHLDLKMKGAPDVDDLEQICPWFECSQSAIKHNRIAFGHWSTLATSRYGSCYALDSGCVWGARMTALRIDKKKPRWFSIDCGELS